MGRNVTETNPVPESILTSKYNSVIVRGFRTDTPMENILEILSQYGLPDSYETDSLTQNESTGSITIENLKPEDCLSLSSRMHKKKFLRRQIFVTSVVANSPVKPAVQVQAEKSSEHLASPQPKPADQGPPNLGQSLFLKPTISTDSSVCNSPLSPGVQQKIDEIEKQASSTSLTDNATDSSSKSRPDKRKSDNSPESEELTRKEKKMLREEEKKQDKLRKKLEYKEKNIILGQINHSY